MARPSYNRDIALGVCRRLAEGESLKAICEDDCMPSRSAVYEWLLLHVEFADMYARAREEQADTLADEITQIADTEEDAARARVRVDARKWVAAKLKPRKYGDRQAVEHSGPNGGPIQTAAQPLPPMTREEWLRTYVDTPAGTAACSD